MRLDKKIVRLAALTLLVIFGSLFGISTAAMVLHKKEWNCNSVCQQQLGTLRVVTK